MMVLFLIEAEMLIFDFGVAEIYYLAAVYGLGIPPPTILTEAVFTLGYYLVCDVAPFDCGLIVEFLLLAEMIELLFAKLI